MTTNDFSLTITILGQHLYICLVGRSACSRQSVEWHGVIPCSGSWNSPSVMTTYLDICSSYL
jgi:hypothetical protein